MKVKVNESRISSVSEATTEGGGFHLCEFCHVETTAPLLYIEIEGFDLDICPTCYHSLDHGGEEE